MCRNRIGSHSASALLIYMVASSDHRNVETLRD